MTQPPQSVRSVPEPTCVEPQRALRPADCPTTTRHFAGAVACEGHDGPLKEGAEHRDGPAAA